MHFRMLSAIRFNLDQSEILSSGNELWKKLGRTLTLCHAFPSFNHPEKESFWKHCGNRKNHADSQHFSLTWTQRLMSWPVVHPCVCPCVCASVRSCVNFYLKYLFLWNYLIDFDEISQKCFFLSWSSSEFRERVWFLQKHWLPWQRNLK